MVRVAALRGLSESELMNQVLGFCLDAMQSDLDLGRAVAIERDVRWLRGFRDGHSLPFSGDAVRRCFLELSSEVEARLESDAQRSEYAAFRRRLDSIVDEAFPRTVVAEMDPH